jgi:hypothetical protein
MTAKHTAPRHKCIVAAEMNTFLDGAVITAGKKRRSKGVPNPLLTAGQGVFSSKRQKLPRKARRVTQHWPFHAWTQTSLSGPSLGRVHAGKKRVT